MNKAHCENLQVFSPITILVVGLLFLTPPLFSKSIAQAVTKSPIDERLSAALNELADASPTCREHAAQLLRKYGQDQRESLKQLQTHSDQTIAALATSILKDIDAYAGLKEMNVRAMTPGYCLAGSKIVDAQALGGFYADSNFPTDIEVPADAARGEVFLVADVRAAVPFQKDFQGMELRLVNATDAEVAFPASDSRLYIVQEARDRNGNWKPIDFLMPSDCGNSRHRAILGPKQQWTFIAPRFFGEFKTKLRFRLAGRDRLQREPAIYSNEFDGSVNAEQFIEKKSAR